MTRTLPIIIIAAAAALAGCERETIVSQPGGPDPMANAVANAGNVTLPPSISASKAYRCKDNSLVYVDWLSDGSARLKKTRNGVGTPVPMGEGSPIQGDAQAATITYNGQSCKA
jgi:hypothetical protein